MKPTKNQSSFSFNYAKMHVYMGVNYDEIDLNQIAEGMAEYARDKFNFLGAAVLSLVAVADRPGELRIKPAEYVTRLSRPPEPDTRGPNDMGTNYLAMAQGKAARRLRQELKLDNQTPVTRRGEPEAGGDDAVWLTDSQLLITAFSGAPKAEQDKIIAELGIIKFWDSCHKINLVASLG